MSSGCYFLNGAADSKDDKGDSSPPGDFESSLPPLEHAGPFGRLLSERTDNIETSNNDGDDMFDDIKSVGSFPSDDNTNIEDAAWTAEQIFGAQTQEESSPGDIPFEEAPSSHGNNQGKAQKVSTRKQRGFKKKDKKASNAAKKREINKWKKYFDHWLSTQPNGIPPGTDFMELARKMIDDEDLDQHTKLRQHYVLDKGFQINTIEEMKIWWTTVKSFGKVPRGDYEKNDCPVCKCGPERKLVDLSDHNCPYCHDCFTDSGYKKLCVLKEDCMKHHVPTEV